MKWDDDSLYPAFWGWQTERRDWEKERRRWARVEWNGGDGMSAHESASEKLY